MKEYYIVEKLSGKNVIFDKKLKKWKVVNDICDYKGNNNEYHVIFTEDNLVDQLNKKYNGYYTFKKVYLMEVK